MFKATIFKNIYITTEPLFVDVVEIFKRIKEGNSLVVIDKIRNASTKEESNEFKKRLPSICFSGRFSKREAEYLLEHSGLICLDIDDLKREDVEKIKEEIIKDEYIYGCFVSPSGLGLKLIIKITPDKNNHKSQFLALEKYYNEKLSKYTSTKENKKKDGGKINQNDGKYLTVHIDKSGKDVNRVCYESFDQDIYYNEDSEIWIECLEEVTEQKEVSDYDTVIQMLQVWIDKKESYFTGNRNNFLYQFSCAMCRYGVSEMRCLSYLHSRYDDYPLRELETTVRGAYKASEFGIEKFTENEKKTKTTTASVKSYDAKPVTAFWSINDKGRVKIDTKQFLKFVAANGFGIYRQNRGDNKLLFVKVLNMVVDVVTVVDIKKHVLEYVSKHAVDAVFDELQMKNRYFEPTFLNALPLIEVEQIRDKSDCSFIFFDEYYYKITANEMKRCGYVDLDGRHIWRSQVCKRGITEIVDYQDHAFNTFVFNAMGKDLEKYKSACSALGYGIHTYKKKRLAKLIYACDMALGELDGMASGGTGKNLFYESLKIVRSYVNIDGKDFDKKDKFKFQTVSDDTQIVLIDDYESDIKELFTKITGHFEVEKKSIEKKNFDFEVAPKIFVSSNSAPKGFSSSFNRRLHLLEFADHYNEINTPAKEFGDKDFFSDDWDQKDYNAVYSFLFACVQFYLKNGLVESINKIDNRFKQLVKNTGVDFAEYFKSFEFGENWHNGSDVFENYVKESGDDVGIQGFYSKLRKLAAIYGMKYETNGKGKSKEFKILKK